MFNLEYKHIKIYQLIIIIFWLVLIISLSYRSYHDNRMRTLAIAYDEANSNIKKDLNLQIWNSSHQNIYVPLNEKTPVNKYLKNHKYKTITHPNGQKLTLLIPAYILKQVCKQNRKTDESLSRIISNKPINPENITDAWEEQALGKLRLGSKEELLLDLHSKCPKIRLIRPLFATKSCLRCHTTQNYKINDIIGGISSTIFLKQYLQQEKATIHTDLIIYLSLFLIGLFLILFGGKIIHKKISKEQAIKEELRISKENLLNSQEVANIGNWQWDLTTNNFTYTPIVANILGIEQNCKNKNILDIIKKIVLKEDITTVMKKIQNVVNSRIIRSMSFRINHPQKGIRWIECGSPKLLYNPDNPKQIKAMGIIQDITEHRKMGDELTATVEELQKFNSLAIDRELKMIELKNEVNNLCKKLKLPPKYTITEDTETKY